MSETIFWNSGEINFSNAKIAKHSLSGVADQGGGHSHHRPTKIQLYYLLETFSAIQTGALARFH
jgi:hypothetical protein